MTQSRYTGTALTLHWLSALLIFCGFGLGLFMTGVEFSPAKFRYYSWHKWIGITVFLLAAARLAWRAGHPAPSFRQRCLPGRFVPPTLRIRCSTG